MIVTEYTRGEKLPDGYIELYTEAFPEDERRDWKSNSDAENFIKEHKEMSSLLVFDDNSCFIGFLNYWLLPDRCSFYCEHFAIDKRMRDKGVGAELFDKFRKMSSDRIILEVEPPADDTSRRRIDMYRRNGMALHSDIEYIQPSYNTDKEPVRLVIMASAGMDPKPLINPLKELVYGMRQA